jgi:hypothetical protein
VNKSSYITSSNQYITITSKLTYNKTLTTSNTIQIYYAPIVINTGLTSNSMDKNFLSGSTMLIDLSSASSSNSVYSLDYSVTCPSTIFSNTTSYNSLCGFTSSSKGIF